MTRYFLASALLMLLVTIPAFAAPQVVRSHDNWAIYAQHTPDDWEALLTSENLALGKPVTMRPAPSYSLTTDENDAVQLTDGVISARDDAQINRDRLSVGWGYTFSVRLTVDLEEQKPVERVLIRLQGGAAQGTNVPRAIEVFVSDDGEYFHPARNITTKLSDQDNPALTFEPLPTDGPAVYAFALDVGYEARYVRFDITAHRADDHIVSDEIAVLAGAGQLRQIPPPPPGEPEYYDNVFDRREQFQRLIEPGNLAAGLQLHYVPKPNYRLTTDENDPFDLTDGNLGERVPERIWFEKGAVGWQHTPIINIFADLGSVQPVDYVVWRLLGGGEQGSLRFPDEIRVLLSNDGHDYYQVSARHRRGLDDLSEEAWDLPEEGLAWVHNFKLPVGYRARYVALQAEYQRQFFTTDQIAIVKGPDDLPEYTPDPSARVVIVTEGVAFLPLHDPHPIADQPLRTKLQIRDARSGEANGGPCELVMDLPETVLLVVPEDAEAERVTRDGQPFNRYRIPANRNRLNDFYLQSTLQPGETGVLYLCGDSGEGLENERRVEWETISIPKVTPPERLHVSIAWMHHPTWTQTWPNALQALRDMGMNAVGFFPRYYKEEHVPELQEYARQAREMGMKIIANESPAGALASDRQEPETKSQLADGPSNHVCPSYRGQFYQKEHSQYGQHAVWLQPDIIFYDIEAYWHGSMEAPRCARCRERFEQDGFTDWDEFRAAMGDEIHEDLKRHVDEALAEAGIDIDIIYGSYRTQPISPLNDGLFDFHRLYPHFLQMAMPSLYVAGNQMAIADNISRNRALMDSNNIVPWLSTGTYGEYDPIRTRDMILETFANGANGFTYYWYGNFDPLHFKYHAEAVGIVQPVEDIFMDGIPIEGMTCNNERIKVCGMADGNEMAVLVSNYPPAAEKGTRVTITVPNGRAAGVYCLHEKRKVGDMTANGTFEVVIDDADAHMYYIGTRFADRFAQ